MGTKTNFASDTRILSLEHNKKSETFCPSHFKPISHDTHMYKFGPATCDGVCHASHNLGNSLLGHKQCPGLCREHFKGHKFRLNPENSLQVMASKWQYKKSMKRLHGNPPNTAENVDLQDIFCIPTTQRAFHQQVIARWLLMQKLLSMTAAAFRASAKTTVYSIRTARKILIITFLLMANIKGFGLKYSNSSKELRSRGQGCGAPALALSAICCPNPITYYPMLSIFHIVLNSASNHLDFD